MIRKPIVAGQFYESDFQALDKQVNECFLSKFGPGDLPVKKRTKDVLGAICPHAGYQFSGACAAWAYKEIGESKFPDLFVVIGPSHTSYGSGILLEDFQTPFSLVKVDKEFGNALIRNSSLIENKQAHLNEHSIEVQLPFLQFVEKEYLDKIKIVPIVVDFNADYKEIANAIVKIEKETKKKVCVIASSDFTHYGALYGYVPFAYNVKESLADLDNKAVEFIKKLDAKGFMDYVSETGATICGAIPIAILLEVLKNKAKKVRVLRHYSSGDVAGDYSNCVDYISIVLE